MAGEEPGEGPPDNATSPPGTTNSGSATIVNDELNTTLSNINENMGSMAQILKLIYNETCSSSRDMKRSAPTGNSTHERPCKAARTDLESAGELSADEDDKVSLAASDNLEDDVEELVSPKTTSQAEASDIDTDKFLNDIESILESSEATGENIQPKLADIANKRWGRKMAPDKLKEIISKHPTPANCTAMIIPQVNPEIWAQMKSHKKRTDLRISNIQQSLQKATTATLRAGDEILKTSTGLPDSVKKALATHSIDTVALLGHAANELSLLRREQIQNIIHFVTLRFQTPSYCLGMTWLNELMTLRIQANWQTS